jgi:predicted kinase
MPCAPLVHINGAPGVGKLTVAHQLAPLLAARLVDNHTIYNPAFALAEFRTDEFYEAVRTVRGAVYGLIHHLPISRAVVLTDAYFEDSAWGRESWHAILELAANRQAPLFAVALVCEPDEHRRRIVGSERSAMGKIQDANHVDRCIGRPLMSVGADFSTTIDVTEVAPEEVAAEIAGWIDAVGR